MAQNPAEERSAGAHDAEDGGQAEHKNQGVEGDVLTAAGEGEGEVSRQNGQGTGRDEAHQSGEGGQHGQDQEGLALQSAKDWLWGRRLGHGADDEKDDDQRYHADDGELQRRQRSQRAFYRT